MSRQTWQEYDGAWVGRPALVVGNGPSRAGETWRIDEFQGPTIGCNSCWRGGPDRFDPDWLVCFDRDQTKLALGHRSQVLVPARSIQHEASRLEPEWWVSHAGALWAIDPYDDRLPTANHSRKLEIEDSWHPRQKALGNLSGLLAFQFAALAGADPIFLLGMDVGGTLGGSGRVQLSVCDPRWDGYGNHEMAEAHCDDVGGVPVPRGWRGTRRFWELLFQWASRRGIRVRRLTEHGSLSFVPVACDDDLDRQAEGTTALDRRRSGRV